MVNIEFEDPQYLLSNSMPDIPIVPPSTHDVLSDFYVKKTGPNMDIQLTDQLTENGTAYEDTAE